MILSIIWAAMKGVVKWVVRQVELVGARAKQGLMVLGIVWSLVK